MQINELLFAFFDSDGPGGVVILLVLLLACVIYYFLTRWIVAGGQEKGGAHLTSGDASQNTELVE